MNGKGGSKRGGNDAGISLFPFLAVLLCTMGALIMLLVVIAKNVREGQPEPPPAAVREADENAPQWTAEEAEKTLQALRQNIEEADWFAENFEKTRVEAEEKLAEARALLASIENETRKVKDEIERLAGLSEQLDKPDTATSAEIERLKKLLEDRAEQRKRAELELAELQKEAEDGAKSYAIIPYRGTGGTFRRPIYIECGKDKAIIQPEGVVLGPNDFAAGDRPDNPLDAALRVVRQYYMENNQIVRGTEPYPLLIVRPSGVETYAAACASMGSWVRDYGYELVDEDWKIEYPEPSEELRQRLEKQLETSRQRMIGYMAAMAAQRRAGRKYRVDSRGVVQPVEGNGPRGMLSAGSDRPGRGSGGNASGGVGQGRPEMPETLQGRGETLGGMNEAGSAGGETGRMSAQEIAAGRGTANMPQGSPGGAYPAGFAGQPTAAVGAPYGSRFGAPEGQANAFPDSQAGASESEQFDGADATPYNSNRPGKASSGEGMFEQPGQPGQTGTFQGKLSRLNAAQASGENWALRDRQPFSSPVSRTIKIQCDKDRFVLVPQPGLAGVRVVPITDSVRTSTGELVRAIWEFMDSWGMAGEKMYWRPVLKIDVRPGAEQRFEELKRLLDGSGFVIERQ